MELHRHIHMCIYYYRLFFGSQSSFASLYASYKAVMHELNLFLLQRKKNLKKNIVRKNKKGKKKNSTGTFI